MRERKNETTGDRGKYNVQSAKVISAAVNTRLPLACPASGGRGAAALSRLLPTLQSWCAVVHDQPMDGIPPCPQLLRLACTQSHASALVQAGLECGQMRPLAYRASRQGWTEGTLA